MTTHGELAIFRMSLPTDTESSLTDKIEFDTDAIVPDSRSKTVSIGGDDNRTDTKNPAPFLNMARVPDTGFDGNMYTLNLYFDERAGLAEGIKRIVQWQSRDNALPTIFKNGRFGIRNNYRPEHDLVPDNTAGYKLHKFNTFTDLRVSRVTFGTLILKFSGNPLKWKANL